MPPAQTNEPQSPQASSGTLNSSTIQSRPPETADAPSPTQSHRVDKALDLHDSPVEDLFRFLRRQPTKYYASFVLGAVAFFATVAGASWYLAASKAELAATIRIAELSSQIAGLKAELSAASQIAAYQREELRARITEYQSAQQVIQSLQAVLADKDRRLVAAQGCESIRSDFRRAIGRAETLARKSESAEGLAKQEIAAELHVLEGTVTIVKGSLDACAAR